MSQSPSRINPSQPDDPQEIPKWSRAYAQNRSLGLVVFLMIHMANFAAIAGGSYLAGEAYRSDNTPLLWGAIALLIPASVALVYLSVPKLSVKFQHRVIQRLYAREGNVALTASVKPKKIWLLVLGGGFGFCVIASVVMFFFFDIHSRYMQPISALYCVPFLIGIWVLQRPLSGYVALLWPALISIHAILILAGAPILFTGRWEGLNMLIPIFGYGLLTGLLSHLYSRVALRRLKRLTQTDGTHADPSAESRAS